MSTITGTSGDDTISAGNGVDTIYGGDGNDTLSGGNGVDSLYGEGGNDNLTGDNGSDNLTGGAGDDLIDGSGGHDTAYYSGPIGDYSFFSAAGYLHIVHLGGAGADGHDRVINVERLVFADRVIDIGSGKNAPVAGDDHVFINEDTGTYSSGAASVKDNDFDFDGDPITVTGGTFTGTYGTLTLNADGTYSYTLFASVQGLDDGENVTDSFNYTITDNDGSDTGQLVFHIAGLNDAPVANDDTAATSEDAAVSGNVLANDTDVDVEPLVVANPGTYVGAYGTLVLAADGSYTYTPNAVAQGLDSGETGQDVFSYTASDGTASDNATLTVTVNGANDAPVANDDTASTNEDSAGVSGNVLTNDTDVDGEPLTVANPGTYVGTYGTLTLAADGSYTYVPGAAAQGLDTGEIGQDVFAYSASDGTASDSATLTVSISGLNDAPVANDDTAATDENTSVSGNVLANDTDVDVETLTVANPGTYIGAYGTLVLASNGSYTYTPTGAAQALGDGQVVNDVFNYIASDGTAADTATLTVTITGLGSVPHANDDTASTTEDASVSGNVLTNDTDDENDPLTVSNPGTYAGTYGTLTLGANGSYTYTPNAAADGLAAGESAQDVFSYTATDGMGSDSATLTVTVNGTNDAPTIDSGGTDADGSVAELPDGDPNEGTAIHSDSGQVAFDDLDLSDTHSAGFTPQGGGYLGTFTLDPVDQMGDSVGWDFTVSDAALENLSDGQIVTQIYTVEIDDGHGGTVSQDVTITITGAGVGTGPQTVWYIDNSAVGSANLGTQADPYTSIAAFNAAQNTVGGPQVGHTVHLLAGTGTGVYAESDGINLLNGQILIGDANGAVRPTIEATAGDGVNVAQNNTISGLDVGNTSGADIADSGGSVGTLTISDVGTSGTGQIIDVDQGGTLSVTLNSAESLASSGGAIDLAGVGGSFAVTGATTITGVQSGGGIDITGSSVAASLAGGGTVATLTTTAVNFVGNTGSLAIGGGFDIVTTSGTGFNATGGGTVTVTGSGNSIIAGSGTALNIANTTIGAADATFESISAGSGVASAGVGISLVNTGSLGGLHVTGTGAAGSGGTIENKTGADGSVTGGIGIYINNSSDVQLSDMNLHDFSNFAIRAHNVTNLLMDGMAISGTNGSSNGVVDGLAAGTQNGEDSVRLTNVFGTSAITDSTIGGGFTDTLHIENISGTLNLLTLDNVSVSGRNAAGANSGLNIVADNAGTVMNVAVLNSDFTTGVNKIVNVGAKTGTTINLLFDNNDVMQNATFANIVSGGGGVSFNGLGNLNFAITDNDFDFSNGGAGIKSIGVDLFMGGGSTGSFTGIVTGNNIGVSGVANSGSGAAASALNIDSQGSGTFTVLVQDNDIVNYDEAGIRLNDTNGSSTLNAVLVGNTVDEPGANSFTGLFVNAGADPGTDSGQVTNLQLGGGAGFRNDFSNGDQFDFGDVYLFNTAGQLRLSQGDSAATDVPTVFDDNNTPPATMLFTTDPGPPAIIVETADIVRVVATPSTVTEDGATSITYTFLRWGNTQNALTVSFSVGGTATFGTDYSQTGADSFTGVSGTVTFAAGSPVATVVIDPTADASVETSETVTLTITAGAGYTAAGPSGATTTILDDDVAPLLVAAPSDHAAGAAGVMSQADAQHLFEAAIQRWSDAGATAEQIAAMRAVSVTVADLAGLQVGLSEGGHILLDDDGAGYGWFVDSTPGEDSEFAGAGGPAEGRIDALSVILHELGHQIGLGDDYHAGSEAELMHGYIDPGERVLPDSVFAEDGLLAYPCGMQGSHLPLVYPEAPIV